VVFLGTIPKLIPFKQLIYLPVVQLMLIDHSHYRLIGESDLHKIAAEIRVDVPLRSGADHRKSPFALVSMLRGGKTRALLELTRALRERERIPTIYITFSGDTKFSTNKEDFVMALIRRITFAMRSGSGCCASLCSHHFQTYLRVHHYVFPPEYKKM